VILNQVLHHPLAIEREDLIINMDKNNQGEITSARPLAKRFSGLVNKIWSIRFIRFLFVGGINTLFSYLVFSVFILLQFHYAIASFLATILGILFNFFTTGKIVFNNNDPKLLFRFFGVYGIIYLFNLLGLKIFNDYQVNLLIAGAILVFPSAILSYFLNKVLVFRVKKQQN
jgi:putative flippase GtrA